MPARRGSSLLTLGGVIRSGSPAATRRAPRRAFGRRTARQTTTGRSGPADCLGGAGADPPLVLLPGLHGDHVATQPYGASSHIPRTVVDEHRPRDAQSLGERDRLDDGSSEWERTRCAGLMIENPANEMRFGYGMAEDVKAALTNLWNSGSSSSSTTRTSSASDRPGELTSRRESSFGSTAGLVERTKAFVLSTQGCSRSTTRWTRTRGVRGVSRRSLEPGTSAARVPILGERGSAADALVASCRRARARAGPAGSSPPSCGGRSYRRAGVGAPRRLGGVAEPGAASSTRSPRCAASSSRSGRQIDLGHQASPAAPPARVEGRGLDGQP